MKSMVKQKPKNSVATRDNWGMLDTFRPFRSLGLFDELRNWDSFLQPLSSTNPVDIYEDEKAYHIEATIPGFNKEDIQLSLDNDILTIKAEKKGEEKQETKNYIRRERFESAFERSIRLYDKVNVDKIDAELKNGVLSLLLPKAIPETTKKVIEVK